MRIACVCSSNGSRYRFYRTSSSFEAKMKELVPILLRRQFQTLIGGTNAESDVILTVGPLDATLDAEFRDLLMKHLGIVPTCVL